MGGGVGTNSHLRSTVRKKSEHMAKKLFNVTLAGESNQSTNILLTGKKIPYEDAYKEKATAEGPELRGL